MKKNTLAALLCAFLFLLCINSFAQVKVVTQHNDNNRTGWYPFEPTLNQSNVTPTNFGLLYKRNVDDQIYAQPLYVSGVTVTDPTTLLPVVRNVIYVATVNNSVYAFDADDGSINPYWQKNFTPANMQVPGAIDIHASLCGYTYIDFSGNFSLGQKGSFGIVGTPVIDSITNTIYFVSRWKDPTLVDNAAHGSDAAHQVDQGWSSNGYHQILHALDIRTGADKFGSPVEIDPATTMVPGVGPSHDASNMVHWDARRNNQRGGLAIFGNTLYIPYAGHCDMDDYHGWILGYELNDMTNQKIRYATTPNDERGGIWMSGNGPAIDAAGNLYYTNGNANDLSLASSPNNVGLSIVKIAPDLVGHTMTNVSWMKPLSYTTYNTSDLDFGTGLVLIPGANFFVTAHKAGNLFSIKTAAGLGEFNESSPNVTGIYSMGTQAQSHSNLSYFGGSPTPFIYQFSEYTHVSAYPVLPASLKLGTTPVVNTSVPSNIGLEGGFTSVSSNGNTPGSGILWVMHNSPSGGTMHALKADDITQELWNSDMDITGTDKLGHYAKMTAPTIVNGKVYTPTFNNALNVYGLLANNTRCITNVALNKAVVASSSDGVNLPSRVTDGNPGTRWGSTGQNNFIYVDLAARYDVCKVSIQWNKGTPLEDYGADFTISVSDDATNWNIVTTITGNTVNTDGAINNYNENTTGRYIRISITKNGVQSQNPPTPSPFISIQEIQIFGSPANNCVPPSLANMNASPIGQSTATLNWKPVTGITDYIIRYRSSTVSSYVTRTFHDANNGSVNPLSLPINALTCGFNYEFDIQSNCGSGQFSTPSIQAFSTLACSSPCLNLTRFAHGDLGDIQAAGMTCYSAPTFTLTGAGLGLGGNGDQFQFNYTTLNKDEQFIMRVASQDVSPATNQAGIMMRDSVTDIARFIFIGKTGNNQLSMVYRNTVGGAAVSTLQANPGNANFFRIVKAGTTYGAFYGNTVNGPWTQMGTNQVLGFGGNVAQDIYIGMAVSSTSALTLSTASFDNLLESSVALPIQLLNFSAYNDHDEFVSLKWQTAMEENNDHFEIERSTDGINFIKVVRVKAVGNSNTLQSYSATDNKPENGLNFYRLKQVDLDGRFTYSSVETIRFGAGVSPIIYPNPVNAIFTAVPGTELIREIVIYNVLGKAVHFEMGNNTNADMKVNISQLSKGVYFLKVKTDSKTFQFKIMKE